MSDLAGRKVAVYARYSTDKQNPRSVEDQVRACTERVHSMGGEVAEVFADAAVSGMARSRPGLNALRDAARSGRIDVIVCEDISRLGRDSANNALALRELRTWGARLLALDGFDTAQRSATLYGAIKSAMAEEYLEELRMRTRRGMRGLFEGGFATGGRAYGYRSADAGDGTGRRRWVIDEVEAAIVRRLFESFAGGAGIRELALMLNVERIPSARGGKWSHITIRSLLRNPMYAGDIHFGQRDWGRDPETGKRTARARADHEVRRVHRPELRIVDAETWLAAQSRVRRVERAQKSGARPKRGHPLSGLLACGACGELLTVTKAGAYYACSGRKRGHGCTNSASLREDAIRKWLLGEITDRIGAPEMLDGLRAELASAIGGHDREIKRELAERRATLARAESAAGKLLELLTERDTPERRTALADKEAHAELERAAIAALEQRLGAVPVLPTPAAIVDLLRELPRLATERPDATREILGGLLDGPIVCAPPARRGEGWPVRGALLPGEVLAYTAASAMYASGSCGGRIQPLAYRSAARIELSGVVSWAAGRKAAGR